jgi:hypothetical protein
MSLAKWDRHTIYASVFGLLCGCFLLGFVLWV